MAGNSWFGRQLELFDVVAGEQGDAIADLSLSGTYDGDDADIEAAVNDILGVLRDFGLIAAS